MQRTYLQKDRCKFSIGVLSIKLNKSTSLSFNVYIKITLMTLYNMTSFYVCYNNVRRINDRENRSNVNSHI